jgi:tetratricopeptide (TPR) repeat protein
VADRVVVKEGGARWQAETGQYLLAFEGDPADGSLSVIERKEAEAPVSAKDRREAKDSFDAKDVDATDWFNEGVALERKDPEGAIQAYQRAVAANPVLLDARINLGWLLHEAGRLAEAERTYRDAIEACGNDPMLLYNLGVLLHDTNRKDEAIEAYEAALRGDPDLADCHYNLALLREELKQPKAAIRHMAQYRKLTRTKS